MKAIADLPEDLKAEVSDEEVDPEREARMVERAEELASLAKKEIDGGFTLLYSQAVVSLWEALEAMVKDLAGARLQSDEDLLMTERFRSVRIPVADFHRLGEQDRFDLLIREASIDKRADYMPSIAKFESLLEEVGITGSVEETTKRALYEMSKVRNVLVHRAGIVDRKFLDECPWLEYEVGDELEVTQTHYKAYLDAVQEYVLLLINRVRRLHDPPEYVPPSDEEQENNAAP